MTCHLHQITPWNIYDHNNFASFFMATIELVAATISA